MASQVRRKRSSPIMKCEDDIPAQPFDELLGKLQSSPMFQLSLASKELFHSNFLAWIVSQYPREMAELFAQFLPSNTGVEPLVQPKREANRIDLTLNFNDGQVLVIENKVKSLASRDQLKEYGERHSKESSRPAGYLLLSVIRPDFFEGPSERFKSSENCEWQFLSYSKLADLLGECLNPANPYHALLLRDYIEFIRSLSALCGEVGTVAAEDRFFRIEPGRRKLLREVRIHDLVDKIRYSGLTQRIEDQLRSANFTVRHEKMPTGEVGTLSVFSTMTHGVGLFDLKYVLMTDPTVILGVQIQGQQFRILVELTKSPRKAKLIAERLNNPTGERLWFNLEKVPGDCEDKPTRREFNQYNKLFWYRYKKLESSITTNDLANLVVDFAKSIRENQRKLRQQVKTVLSRSM